MLEQQNSPFSHSLVCRCKTPAAFLDGLYLGWFTFPLQSHGKHIVLPSPSICRTRGVRNHLVCGKKPTSTWADTNPTPASLPPPSRASLLCLPSSQRLMKSPGLPGVDLTLWLRGKKAMRCRTDRFYGRWGTCWASGLMMFLFKSAGSLWHSQLRLVCTHSLQLKCSLRAVHLMPALGQAEISLSKVWKHVAFAVLIEKDLGKKKNMPKLSSDLLSNDSVTVLHWCSNYEPIPA